MGNQKLKWTPDEEEALKAGVAKHGAGKWKNILVDSQFAHKLANRSNVDLKDKWRNMGLNTGQGSGDNTMTPKGRAKAICPVQEKNQNSSAASNSESNIKGKPSKSPQDATIIPKYGAMILEALSSIKDHNGSEFCAILRFIEKKYEVPSNFRRLLTSKLRKLVVQGTLEKIQKRYKIKRATVVAKTTVPKQKDARPKPKPLRKAKWIVPAKMLEDAAQTAAQKIVEAEEKSFLAAEAVKDFEWITQMAEDADVQLMNLNEIIQLWEVKGRHQHISRDITQ